MTDMRDEVEAAVTEVMSRHGMMVTKWLFLADVIEDAGSRSIVHLSAEQAAPWDNLGLFDYVRAMEYAVVYSNYRGDPGDVR